MGLRSSTTSPSPRIVTARAGRELPSSSCGQWAYFGSSGKLGSGQLQNLLKVRTPQR